MSPARAGSGSGPGPGPDPWRQASSSSRNGIISSVSGSYYQSHQQGQPQGQAGQAQTQRSFHPITVLNSSSSSSVANAPYNAPASAASAVISAVSAVRPVQPPQGQGQGHDQAYSTHYSRAHHSAAGVTTTTTSTASTLQTQPAASRSSLVTAATPSLHHQYQSQQLQQFPTAAAGVVPAYTPPPPSQGYGQGQAQPTYHHSTSAHIQHSAPPSSSLAYHSQYPHSTYPHQGQYPTAADRATNSISSMASTYDAASATTANGGAGSGGLLGPNSSMIPLTTIPVDTPSNKRGEFAHSLQQSRKNEEEKNPFYQPPEFDPLNFSTLPEKTPRIYDHCVKGLESGLPTEVEFALHHLVIISDERGDKFRFCDFPGLADSLLEAAWEITFLIHGVSFETSYDPISADDPRINVIDGCYGTPDLVRRINALPVTMQGNGEEELETVGLGRYRRMVSEAALVIHNMCTLEENAIWLADMAAFKDWVIYLLNMPAVAREKYVEILNNALETAEMVAPFWVFEKNDALIPGLLECLKSSDRTHIILALRIFVCWGMDRPDARKEMALDGYMTEEILKAVFNSLLLEQDRDMLNTTLDFLYQYTTVPSNVAHVIRLLDSELPTSLIPRLTNLLLFEAEPLLDERIDQEEIHAPPPNDIPDIPPTLHAEICRLPEPERCSTWVRTCFVEDEECEITQLALWNAYRAMFAHVNEPQPLPPQPLNSNGTPNLTPNPQQQLQQRLAPTLGAADFINTVSTSFPSAEAQVIRGEVAKFIIRGIRPLENPIDFRGYPYPRCKWQLSVSNPSTTTTSATSTSPITGAVRTSTKCETRCCGTFDTVDALRDHVYEAHLGLGRDPANGRWIVGEDERPQNVCLWDDCRLYHHPPPPPPPQTSAYLQQQQQQFGPSHMDPSLAGSGAGTAPVVKTSRLVQHINAQHLPSSDLLDKSKAPPPVPPRPYLQKGIERVFEYYPTPAHKEPLGVAYKSLLVMRNVMRNLPPDPPSRGKSPVTGFSSTPSSSSYGSGPGERKGKGESRSHRLFFSQRRRLLETADYNPVLRREIFELVNEIRSS